MASRNKDERALVNKLTKAIQKNSPRVYIHIDRDSGAQRHTSSGWDMMLASSDHVVLCEAKMEKGRLSDWQEFVRSLATDAAVKYRVVRFTNDGLYFWVEGIDERKEIDKACFADFYGVDGK